MANGCDTQTMEAHERRAVYTNALHKSLEIFLSYTEEAIDDVMSNGLRPVADAANLDRIIIFRMYGIESNTSGEIYRWDRALGGTALIDPLLKRVPVTSALKRWISVMQDDSCISLKRSEFLEDEAAFLSPRDVQSILIVPVFTGRAFWGVVTFHDNTDEHDFDNDCTGMLRSAARLCAATIIRGEMEREIADENELNRVMFEAAPIGLTTYNDDMQVVDCNEAILSMYGVGKQYYLDNFIKFSPEYQGDGQKTTDKLADIMKRALNGEVLKLEWLHNTLEGELIPCELLLTRVKYKNKYIGLGYMYDLRNIKKMEKNIQWLKTEADKIYYDPLTGIYNRRYFDEGLKRVMKALSRSGGTLSVMMIDIDFFKNYNDTYGHSEGDKCLKAVANIISQCITRADDFVVRYGGEEFVIVLPNTGEDGVGMIPDKLLESMRRSNIPHKKNAAASYVTVSIGATTGTVEHTQSGEAYIQRADEAMYQSKQNGRDRYTFEKMQETSNSGILSSGGMYV